MADSSSSSATAAAASPFPELNVEFNGAGWGPSGENLPVQFAKVPFAEFSRSDKIGKAADFIGFLKGPRRFGRPGEENAELAHRYDDESRDFNLVDSSKAPKRGPQQYNKYRGGAAGGAGAGGAGAGARGWEDKANPRTQGQGSRFNKRYNRLADARWQSSRQMGPRLIRESSVKVAADWLSLDSFEFAQLQKFHAPAPTAVSDLRWAGSLEPYDEDYDRVTAKQPKKLRIAERKQWAFVGSGEDPVLEELATSEAGGEGAVYATDAVLAHLMACHRSVYPWDIVITVLPGGVMFLDARDQLDFELHSVAETAHDVPDESDPDNINGRRQLTIEASAIHQNFTQQVLASNSGKAVEPPASDEPKCEANPLWDPEEAEEGQEPAAICYRYRKWALSPAINLVARTTVHAVSRRKAGSGRASQLLNVFTVNEWDPKLAGTLDWRRQIDTQRGGVLATEIKNNAFKLAKFTAQMMLSGADSMKLGFVSRSARSDADNHVIMGVHSGPLATWVQSTGVSQANMWGMVRWLVELVRKHAKNLQEDTPDDEYVAKFVLVREPNKPTLTLYNVPVDAFDREEEDGEDEDWANEAAAEEGEAEAEGEA